MSYAGIGNTSDAEQEKNVTDFRLNRSNNNLAAKPLTTKFGDILWNNKQKSDDSDSEISDSANFLAKGSLECLAYCELSILSNGDWFVFIFQVHFY